MLPDDTDASNPVVPPHSFSQSPSPVVTNGFSPDWPAYPQGFEFSQEETNQLLASLQQSAPDIGRLFDGSIGAFGWTG